MAGPRRNGHGPSLSPRSKEQLFASDFTHSDIHPETDLLCFSHLRWDFVYQRPQHLLSRCARQRRVFFWEEPVWDDGTAASLVVSPREDKLVLVTPHLPHGMDPQQVETTQRSLLAQFMAEHKIERYVLWYYTPMALAFSSHLQPGAVVYDCMDELSAFKGAPPVLREREAELFRRAHLVFTGGQSLYEAKRTQHPSVHAFPSSIDARHFAQARRPGSSEPSDQAEIPHPRIGFFGVLDERLDRELLRSIAEARPDWHFIMIGPVVKIDPSELPQASNIHYLGSKSYKELPTYIAGWAVALLLFAHNDSTRFISPTKTPEYLAAGKPVVSTSIRDVVRPYGDLGLARIADTRDDFVKAIEESLQPQSPEWLNRVDSFLSQNSWDITWAKMWGLISKVLSGTTRSQVYRGQQAQLQAISTD